MIIFPLHTVVIHSGYPGLGKNICNQFFNFFGTEVFLAKLMAAAGDTGMNNRVRAATVMTGKQVS
jgi:hypothetical protein